MLNRSQPIKVCNRFNIFTLKRKNKFPLVNLITEIFAAPVLCILSVDVMVSMVYQRTDKTFPKQIVVLHLLTL